MHALKKEDQYYLCIVIHGQLQVLHNNNMISLKAKQALLCPCNHSEFRVFGAQDGFYLLQLSGADIKALLDTVDQSVRTKGHVVFDLDEKTELIGQICDQLLFETNQSREQNRMISIMLDCIVSVLFHLAQFPQYRESGVVDQAMQYISEHMNENITLENLAEITHVSASYLSHVFKEKTGVSPIRYVINCRMEQAKLLLRNTNESISRISMKIGYDNSNYFSLLFKKTVGCSPAQYRRRQRNR